MWQVGRNPPALLGAHNARGGCRDVTDFRKASPLRSSARNESRRWRHHVNAPIAFRLAAQSDPGNPRARKLRLLMTWLARGDVT